MVIFYARGHYKHISKTVGPPFGDGKVPISSKVVICLIGAR